MMFTDYPQQASLSPDVPASEPQDVPVCVPAQQPKRSPFVLKFRTEQHFYIYDVNLNEILKVEPGVYELIEDYGVLTPEQFAKQYATYSPGLVEKTLSVIRSLHRDQGWFSSKRPNRVCFQHDALSLREIHEGNLTGMLLSVAHQCNFRCHYCPFSGKWPSGFRHHEDRHMSWDIARKAVDFFEAHSRLSDSVHISFYGGEPLIEASLIRRCIEYSREVFKHKPLSFHATTNASLLSGAVCDHLIRNKVHVAVSLDGPRHMHDRNRRDISGRGTFDRILRNLTMLEQASPEYYRNFISFICVLSPPFDVDAIEAFFGSSPLFKNNRVTFRLEALAPVSDDQYTSEEVSFGDQINGMFEAWLRTSADQEPSKILREMMLKPLKKLRDDLDPRAVFGATGYFPSGTCIPAQTKMHVDYRGKIFLCEKVPTASDRFCIGNVDDGIDITKAIELVEMSVRASDDCASCVACRHCSLCPMHGATGTGYDVSARKELCQTRVSALRNDLVNMMRVFEINPKAFDRIKIEG